MGSIGDTIYIEQYNIELDRGTAFISPMRRICTKKLFKLIPIEKYYMFIVGDHGATFIIDANKSDSKKKWQEIKSLIDLSKKSNVIPFSSLRH